LHALGTITDIWQSWHLPVGEYVVNGKTTDNFSRMKDGTRNEEYCNNCYRDGGFTEPEITLPGMIDRSVDFMTKEMKIPEKKAAKISREIIRGLDMWKNVKKA
jgi:hypothetical protein